MSKRDRLQGALDLLILKTLTKGPMHGFGITTHIQNVSRGVLDVEEGSLYPALKRLEIEGWVSSEWKVTVNNRRARYYQLTKAGRRYLEQEAEEWSRVSSAVRLVLNHT